MCSLLAAQAFLQKLVRNLFAEGNDLFREKDFKLSLVQYVEGLNVADYAASDEVTIPKELLCKLHVNRAACYYAMVSMSILQYSGSKRLRTSIFLRNLTAFLYGATPEQVHPVHNEAESHEKNEQAVT